MPDQQGDQNNLPENPWLNIPLAVSPDGELPLQNLIEFYIYENLDESYPDTGTSNPFTNYNGSILQFIKDVSSKPFNEMYWTHVRGLATFIYRPTPFDPENWKALNITEIPPSLITDVNIGTNDQEQAAVFKITPTNGMGQTEYDGGWAGNLAPLTNMDLIRRYGYKLLQAQTDYFNGSSGSGDSDSDSDSDSDDKDSKDNNSQDQGSTGTTEGDIQNQRTAGTQGADSEAMKGYTAQSAAYNYPPYTSIVDAFYYTSGRKTGNSANISIPKEAGGTLAYEHVRDALNDSRTKGEFLQRVSGLDIPGVDKSALWTLKNNFNRTRYLQIVKPNYNPTSKAISKNSHYLRSYARMQKNPKKAASELIDELGFTLGPKQAYEIVLNALANGGKPTEDAYNSIINNIGFDEQEDGVTGGVSESAVPFLFLQYTRKLFNWNADNAKFYSGTITVHGLPNYANAFIGERIMFFDDKAQCWWEFYCEGVKTSWDYQNGLQMTFDVTRGVPLETEYDSFDKRFTEPWSFWGKSIPFRGGYFGEQNLATAIANSNKDDGGSGKGSGDLIKTAKDVMHNMNWTYSQGQRTDFRKGGHADCSSFVWYVCNKCGYDVGDSAFWTGTEPNYLDEISADETKSGSIVIANGDPHTAFLEEKWHGTDTQIINMGGEGPHDGMGDVNEDTYARAFGSANMSGMKFYKARKK